MNRQEQQLMADLIRSRRWAALATHSADGPDASWVAYASEADFGGFLLHLSTLAAHTRNLLASARAALAISATEQDGQDPQTLARVSIQGEVTVLTRDSAAYQAAAQCYLHRLPDAAERFAFGDFLLLRLVPVRVRFIGSFARAYTLDDVALRAAARNTLSAPVD